MVYQCASSTLSKLENRKMFGYMAGYVPTPVTVLLEEYLDYSWHPAVSWKLMVKSL